MVLVHPRTSSPDPDEAVGGQLSVRCCQGCSESRIPLRGGFGRLSRKVGSVVMKATCAAWVSKSPTNRVTFKAQGGEIENIKTGREMTLVRRGRSYVLRMWFQRARISRAGT